MGFENGRLVGVRVRVVQQDENELVSVYHYDLQDSAIPGNAANSPQDLADRFADDVVTALVPLTLTTSTIDPIVVFEEKDPQNPLDARSEWVSGDPTPGTRSLTNDLLPPGNSALATLRTAHIGKRFRGRTWLPLSLQEGDSAAGILQSGIVTFLQDYLDAIPMQPDIATGDSASVANWCVYSRTQRAANLDPYASAVVSAELRPTTHFLRSRAR